MSETYILPPEAGKKLKIAKESFQPVFIYGITGSGKTSLIKNSKETGSCLYVSGLDESAKSTVEKKINSSEKRIKVVAIDDLSFVTDESFRELIKKIALNEDVWLILSDRGRLPEWLKPSDFLRKFMVISEEDLLLRPSEIQTLLMRLGITLEEKDIERIFAFSEGNAYMIYSIAVRLQEGMSLKKALDEEQRSLIERAKQLIIPAMPKEVQKFLMAVSVVDSFTAEMAAVIYGVADAKPLIRASEECTNILSREGAAYRMRDLALTSFREYVKENVSENEMWKYYERAGKWYEDRGLFHLSMALYEKTGSRKRINALLLKNSEKVPGTGQFYEMRRFYLSISEEEAMSDPRLMAALSTLNSVLMDIDTSEKWYEKLKSYDAGDDLSRKELVDFFVNLLDITLPHRKTADLIPSIERMLTFLEVEKPPYTVQLSATGFLPSLLDGNKDLCEWVHNPKEHAEKYQALFKAFQDPIEKGLVPLFLSECAYQKGEASSNVLKELSEARFDAEQGGSPETLFAAACLSARLFMISGEIDSAVNVIRSFSKKLEDFGNDAVKLKPNVAAVKTRLALYRGDMDEVDEWLLSAPNEEEFCMNDRFLYVTKVRAYIAKEKYIAALSLIEKLSCYAKAFNRTILKIELLILSAVVRQRTDEPYEEDLLEALELMSDLNFIRIMSEEGPIVITLLSETLKHIEKDNKIDKSFFERLYSEIRKTSNAYPLYLKGQASDAPSLPERAITILRLQSEGYTMKQIAEKLSMKEPTVKYYIKNTYLKLSASSKTDAVMKAQAMGLL